MKKFSLLVVLIVSMLFAAVAPAAQAAENAQNACDGGEGVYLYEHDDYQGRCVRFTSDVPDLSDYAFNNITSSIRIVGGWTVTLYVDQNYGNVSSTFTRDDPNLADDAVGNDRASSLRIQRRTAPVGNVCDGSEGVYFYEHDDYQGRCIRFTGDVPDLRPFGFDDLISSVRFVGYWSATLYRDLNFTGVSSTFTQDDIDLIGDAVGNDQTTSIRVQRRDVLPPGNICDGGEGVYLYEHTQYRGRCLKLTADAPDLRVFAFDDLISSVRFVGSWTATLYRDLSGTGISSTFIRDDSDLRDDGVGNDQVTSVRVQRGGAPPVGNACDGSEGVYLYEHPFYQGRCIRLTSDASDLRVLAFDDTTSSVRFVGSWTATLYRDLSGTGISSTFTQDAPFLHDVAIGDNQVTSVRVQRR
jgi:GNAT superfamily N-acetyltransferase